MHSKNFIWAILLTVAVFLSGFSAWAQSATVHIDPWPNRKLSGNANPLFSENATEKQELTPYQPINQGESIQQQPLQQIIERQELTPPVQSVQQIESESMAQQGIAKSFSMQESSASALGCEAREEIQKSLVKKMALLESEKERLRARLGSVEPGKIGPIYQCARETNRIAELEVQVKYLSQENEILIKKNQELSMREPDESASEGEDKPAQNPDSGQPQ